MQRGFVPIIILVGILLLASIGGAYYFLKLKTPEPKACTMDAKICPDGTSVGRVGPSCEFAPCPTESSPTPTVNTGSEVDIAKELKAIDDKNGWKTYRLEAVKLEFKLPEILIRQNDLREITTPGQVGSQTTIYTLGMYDRFTIGITSIDYQQGRGGSFMDLQGYKFQDGKYYAKFVGGQTFEIPSDTVRVIKNSNGISILKIQGKNQYSEAWGDYPIAGTPGSGYMGALINVDNNTYSGVAIRMKLDNELTKQIFDQILANLKLYSR